MLTVRDAQSATTVAQKVIEAVSQPYDIEGRTVGTVGALTSGACLDLPAVEEL